MLARIAERIRLADLPVWEQPGHFQPGSIVQLPPYGFGQAVVWTDGELVNLQDMDGTEEIRVARMLRHATPDCPPCRADFDRLNDAAEDAHFKHQPETLHSRD
ncbi:hypothetical protein ACIBEA_40460 [Streptomyces sp. NPDC051555]|uniref:hypothetical protein n=1 Tax=Streptomyces sp. NPDC051555 TaxID=3365657 RepID=UPI0037AF855E